MPSKAPPLLSEDELDDLLYFSRAGELTDFKSAMETSAKRLNAPHYDIFLAAVDESSGNGPLHMASANGHTGILAYALALLPSPNTAAAAAAILDSQNASGNTPLHWAALNGHLEAVKLLVRLGADPSVTNRAGHDAVFEAEVNGKEEVVGWLLTEGKGLDAGVKGGGAEGVEEGDMEGEGREDGEGVDVGEGTG